MTMNIRKSQLPEPEPEALGPKQLQWLRDNIPGFAEMRDRSEAARHGGITPRKGTLSELSTPKDGETE